MSTRPQLAPHPVIIDGDMSNDIVSEITIIQKLSTITYSFSWIGSSPVGEVTIEVSNDYSQNADGSVRNAGTWSTLPISTMDVSGDTGVGAVDIYTGFYAIRARYTVTSGNGSMQALINAKVA